MVQKMRNGRKNVVASRQSNNSGIHRFNSVIGISTSQGECTIRTTDTRRKERARKSDTRGYGKEGYRYWGGY